ncbi:MAG: D-glycero-beta-D-manno-heptose 1-phosphate adenylyltransferase [Tumebacillaceae bacterium]
MHAKILTLDDTLAFIKTEKALGRKTVFTNGCFDLLHRGHVEYLQFARAQGDLLIVGVNSDESVRALKGPARPLNSLEDRLLVLAALEAVTCVIPFHTLTPEPLVAALQPDIFVKGGDYTIDRLPEAQIVQSYGGAVVLAPLIAGRSTTNMIDRMGAATS